MTFVTEYVVHDKATVPISKVKDESYCTFEVPYSHKTKPSKKTMC